ncbi:MAG: hypothetical protein HY211_04910 [Candidatus Omnitrophica bacterium]|nr:hypothetical protein [Candidatus Omnitrophota bacterium]
MALFLALCLGLPSAPAFALRNQTTEGAGLEEQLTQALQDDDPIKGVKTVVGRFAQLAVPPRAPLTPRPVAAGMEEFRLVMQLDSASSKEYPRSSLIAFNPVDQVLLLGKSEEPDEGDEYSSPSDTFRIQTWSYKVPTKEKVGLKGELKKALSDGKLGVRKFVFSPDGKSIYVHRAGQRGKSATEEILAYSWRTGATIGSGATFNAEELDVQDIAGSPDGKTVFVLARHPRPHWERHRSYRWIVLPFSIRTGQPRTKETLYPNPPLSSQGKAFDSDLIQAMLGGISPSFATPTELLVDPHRNRLYIQYVHHRALAETQGIEIHAYDLETRQPTGPIFRVQTRQSTSLDEYTGKTLALSPDGKTLYVGMPENDDPFRDPTYAFDAETGEPKNVVKIPGRISSLAVSPDGVVSAVSFFRGGKTENQLVEFLSVLQAGLPGQEVSQLPLDARLPNPPAAGLEENAAIDALIGDMFGLTGELTITLKGDRLSGEINHVENPYQMKLKWFGKQRKEDGVIEAHLELRFERTDKKKLAEKDQKGLGEYAFRILQQGSQPLADFISLVVQPPFKVPAHYEDVLTDYGIEPSRREAYTDPGGNYASYDFAFTLGQQQSTEPSVNVVLQVNPPSPVIPASYTEVKRPIAALPAPAVEQPAHWKPLQEYLAAFKTGETLWTKDLVERFPAFSEGAVRQQLEWSGWGKGRRWDDANPQKGTRFYKRTDPDRGTPVGEPPAAGMEESLSEHVDRFNTILDGQRWGELRDAARNLRNLMDQVMWHQGIEPNREALLRLNNTVQRVQGLGPTQRPQDAETDRLLRRWEASAVALLSAVSFGSERFLSEGVASGFLGDEQSLEGHLLYRLGTLWEQSVDLVGHPEAVGLVGITSRYPNLGLTLERESDLWVDAIEVLLWTTPFNRFEQSPQELEVMYRQGPALKMVPLIASFDPQSRIPDPSQVLEVFSQVLGEVGSVPIEVRRAFLLRRDAAVLNLWAAYYHILGSIAARAGRPEAAGALINRATALYENITHHVDSNYQVWRPSFRAAPPAPEEPGLPPTVQPSPPQPTGAPRRVQISPEQLIAALRQAGIRVEVSKTKARQLLKEQNLDQAAVLRVLGRSVLPGRRGQANAARIAEVVQALRSRPQRTPLGDHVAQINQIIDQRQWTGVPQMSRQLVELMMQILPEELGRNSEALHQLDQAVQRVQGLPPEQRPQDAETDRALRRWEANAIGLLSAASFRSELYLSQATAYNFLNNPRSLEGHLWFLLDSLWGAFVRQGRAAQVGLGGIPRIAVPPQQRGQEWSFWLDALQVLIWSTRRGQFDPTQVNIGPLLDEVPAQTLPSLIAQWDPQGSRPSSSLVQSAFSTLVAQMGRVPVSVRLKFLLRQDAPVANLSGVFLHFVSVLADRVGSPHAGEFMSQRAVERYDSINRVIDSQYEVWRPTFNAGMEEKGTPAVGLKVLLEYVAREDVIRTIALLAESGKTGDVTSDFPALEGLAKKAGFAGGIAAILRTVASGEAVLGVPAEYAAQGIPVYVKKEWEGKVRENLNKLEATGRIRFVGDAAEAYLVIGDDSVSARPDQVFIAINGETVSQVTPHLLQELQISGLLKAGSVVMLYKLLKDSVLVFA